MGTNTTALKTGAKSLNKKNVHKRTNRFNRFGSDMFMRVGACAAREAHLPRARCCGRPAASPPPPLPVRASRRAAPASLAPFPHPHLPPPLPGASWRKPHGIDNRARRRYKGNLKLPSAGYGTNKKTRHVLPNGFKKVLVSNAKELEVLLMHNRTYCAEIANSVSKRVRKAMVERAEQLGIRVTNAAAGLTKADGQ